MPTYSRRQFLTGAGLGAAGLVVVRSPLAGAATSAASTSAASTAGAKTKTKPPAAPPARLWMMLTMDLVRTEKPTPPAAARLYAYVASTYADAFAATTSAAQASEATRQVLTALLPKRAAEINMLAPIIAKHPTTPNPKAKAVADRYLARISSDGFTPPDPAHDMDGALTGPGKWVRVDGKGPLAPKAGSWQRWLVPAATTFAIPAPFEPGDVEYEQQKQAVVEATARRDAAWTAKITFWGGNPGTETPAGIWQNRLWAVTSNTAFASADASYAPVQAVLAKSIADSFIECWKCKYTHWTERPDMAMPEISRAMDNPPFPAYVSGHSTISATAATILSHYVPDKAPLWMNDAKTARDSRLYAGIHFPMDNDRGFELGIDIAKAILATPPK